MIDQSIDVSIDVTLHYNEHADRMQAVAIDGRPRCAIQFPKAKKGQPTVR